MIFWVYKRRKKANPDSYVWIIWTTIFAILVMSKIGKISQLLLQWVADF